MWQAASTHRLFHPSLAPSAAPLWPQEQSQRRCPCSDVRAMVARSIDIEWTWATLMNHSFNSSTLHSPIEQQVRRHVLAKLGSQAVLHALDCSLDIIPRFGHVPAFARTCGKGANHKWWATWDAVVCCSP